MFARAVLLCVLCSLTIGCAQRTKALPNPEPIQISYLHHTVATPGETLGHIAQWYSGDWKNWEFIASHNPGLNPKRIKVGDQVRIPDAIVIKRTPLPKQQVMDTQMRQVVGQMTASREKIRSFVSGMMSQFRSAK